MRQVASGARFCADLQALQVLHLCQEFEVKMRGHEEQQWNQVSTGSGLLCSCLASPSCSCVKGSRVAAGSPMLHGAVAQACQKNKQLTWAGLGQLLIPQAGLGSF